ncbi:hypothetical protein OAF98_02080 [Planctomicrobium sp.]|jgi:hypothetical protein|nr:hypothetical protein [Planctomicrobium sp.]MDA7527452.1 hypothetical protein [bacterium]MBT5018569.1 hypothetical protein [Planctomicrobium sp.]MDB4440014.1 hypothetical protein [Planctomicrobium sp.]MDB4731293.1 hypothetical protein [bacterium]MDB4733377.1 hypothetical protein [Planctomicrobium sp.]
MLKFHPGIARSGIIVEFPHPVLVFRIRDAWDFEKMKVPLRDGDQIVGHSKAGSDIAIEGQIGQHSGSLKLSEPEMLTTLNTIRDALDVNSVDGSYSLVAFNDDAVDDHRYFKNCTTTKFEFDLSNPNIYSFAAVIHAADPILYSGSLPAL